MNEILKLSLAFIDPHFNQAHEHLWKVPRLTRAQMCYSVKVHEQCTIINRQQDVASMVCTQWEPQLFKSFGLK